jgi:hypothetical protein
MSHTVVDPRVASTVNLANGIKETSDDETVKVMR